MELVVFVEFINYPSTMNCVDSAMAFIGALLNFGLFGISVFISDLYFSWPIIACVKRAIPSLPYSFVDGTTNELKQEILT